MSPRYSPSCWEFWSRRWHCPWGGSRENRLHVPANAAAGFAADVRKSGPDTVEVRFTSGKRESRVEIRIENGVPRERVEDR